MAGDNKRKSYLSLKPVDFSLTAGTNIPAPLDSPPHSPADSARPPTAGGGPLSSHPTPPEDVTRALPPTPDPEKEPPTKMSTSTSASHQTRETRERTDSFPTPVSPASTHHTQSRANGQQQQSKAPRKLFSLGNLRQSFSSSRTSLHSNYQRPSTDNSQPASHSHGGNSHSFKTSSSPKSSHAAQPPAPQPRPQSGRSKSGNWFRRKSGMFLLNDDVAVQGGLDAVVEDQTSRPVTRPVTRESVTRESVSRVKENYSPAPLLPEIGGLGRGGSLSGGEIGWDEGLFRK